MSLSRLSLMYHLYHKLTVIVVNGGKNMALSEY